MEFPGFNKAFTVAPHDPDQESLSKRTRRMRSSASAMSLAPRMPVDRWSMEVGLRAAGLRTSRIFLRKGRLHTIAF